MKLNVCKEITYLDPNGETIASFQPNVSPGRRYNLKLQASVINFENCLAQQYFKNPYRNPFQSSSLLVIPWLFLYFTEFNGHFPCLNLAKIRDRAPLTNNEPDKSSPNHIRGVK